MVGHRLSAHGIDPATVEWDSWRRADGSWTVVARFEAVPAAAGSIGEEPPAMWTFSPQRKALQNANRWAQQLSELEPLDGPVPARRLTAVSDRPFDFETDAQAAGRAAAKDSDNLLEMLRSRRGQRLGVDEDADDALAVLLSNVPAAHPRPEEDEPHRETVQDPAVEIPAESPAARKDSRHSMLSRLSLAPRHADPEDTDDSLKLHDGVSTETREITVVAGPLRPVTSLDDRKTAGEAPTDEEAGDKSLPVAASVKRPGLDELLGGSASAETRASRPQAGPEHQDSEAKERHAAKGDDAPVERQPSRPKRSSIPSWDEIVFGARGD
jgi:hypothetical protein